MNFSEYLLSLGYGKYRYLDTKDGKTTYKRAKDDEYYFSSCQSHCLDYRFLSPELVTKLNNSGFINEYERKEIIIGLDEYGKPPHLFIPMRKIRINKLEKVGSRSRSRADYVNRIIEKYSNQQILNALITDGEVIDIDEIVIPILEPKKQGHSYETKTCAY